MRGDRLARQWKIIQLLLQKREGMRAFEIASQLNLSVRNVYRDLEALQLAGFPLFNQRDGKNVRWALVEGFRHNTPIPFTTEELMSLEMARGLLEPLDGTVFAEALEQGLSKVQASLPQQVCGYLERLRGVFCSFDWPMGNYKNRSQDVRLLSKAVTEEETIQFDYLAFSTRQTTVRKVDPYGIFYNEGTIYLVGYCHLRRDKRTFVVNRMDSLCLTGQSFSRPHDFDLQEQMKNSLGVFLGPPEKVVVSFDSNAARFIKEKFWHPSQRLQELPDGGCILELFVPISKEITRWVLSWAPHCVVLEPKSMAKSVVLVLQQNIDCY
jgi:predicted DNA-binding transcriptional regulator YafY